MLDARRRACLEAMGIELWRSRSRSESVTEPALVEPSQKSGGGDDPTMSTAASAEIGPSVSMTEPAPVPAQQGVESRPATEKAPGSLSSAESEEPLAPPLEAVASLDWAALHETVKQCTLCGLHEGRTQSVFGVGDPSARLLIVGEAPGVDEDRQGEPFVGRAGQLLNAMLAAIGLQREQVYIANIIKCRPPGNRDPHADEALTCQPFLHRQIALIAPELILSVGRISAHNLLGTEAAVGRLRGQMHRFEPGNIPLIVTYHPAYLLRRPTEKAKAWQDLQAVRRFLLTAQHELNS